MTFTFGKKLAAGFFAAILTLLAVATVSYRATLDMLDNDRLVAHSHLVRRELAALLSELKDAETSQRGFLLAGSEPYLGPYEASRPAIERSFETLRALFASTPEQRSRIESLRQLCDTKITEMQRTIDVRKAEGLDASLRIVLSDDGRKTMDLIRARVLEIDGVEAALLEHRRLATENSATGTKTVILWGSALGTIFLLVAGTLLSRSLASQIGAAAQGILSSSAELQAASTQQATSAREQTTAMSEISTTISELLATSRQIAESAQRVAQAADQTTASTRAGDVMVGRGNDSMGGIRKQVDLIVNHMLTLGKKSQEIGAVLDIVSELAEQTNILAINATIEAAGAGDSGKRFAVVADEIRKLAERVAGSMKDIRTLIDDVRGAVNTTVMTTETGSKAVEVGARNFGDVAAAFTQIAGQVVNTTEAAKEIGLSTKQQASAVEQVNVAITNVTQASKETEVSTTQTLKTASELAGLARRLLDIVQPETTHRAAP